MENEFEATLHNFIRKMLYKDDVQLRYNQYLIDKHSTLAYQVGKDG